MSMTRRTLVGGAALMAGARLAGVAQMSQTGASEPATGGPEMEAGIRGPGSLRAHGEAKRMRVGCAVNTGLLARDAAYRSTLAEQMDTVVAENCMKWTALRPTATTYDFREADALMAFAEAHGMAVRGHNLCWHEQLPGWFAGTATKDNARALLTEHIATVAGRYKGRIQSWDVVNEAIHIQDGQGDGMRSSSPWFALLGREYLEIAYQAARAADPQAKLTYNDFGIEYDTEDNQQKRAAVLTLVRRLKEARVPIDAVGIQSHLKTSNLAKLGDGIAEFSGKIRGLGLEVYITEMDVDDDTMAGGTAQEQERAVADVYRRYLDAMLVGPEVKSVLMWGLANGQSWLQGEKWRKLHPDRAQRPLLFAEKQGGGYEPDAAYFVVRAAMDRARRR